MKRNSHLTFVTAALLLTTYFCVHYLVEHASFPFQKKTVVEKLTEEKINRAKKLKH